MKIEANRSDNPELLAAKKAIYDVKQIGVVSTVFTAAELGISDIIGEGQTSYEVIAQKVGTNPEYTYRLLRALEAIGYYQETSPGVFKSTILGLRLRENDQYSVKYPVQWVKIEGRSHMDLMTDAIKTGKQSMKKIYGYDNVFDLCNADPKVGRACNDYMGLMSIEAYEHILDKFPFENYDLICDVGGGSGQTIKGILDRTKRPKGMIFDLPYAVEQAKKQFQNTKFEGRISYESGSFFEEVPKSQVYVLKHIIHDWDDDKCITILKNIRKQIPSNGKCIIIEQTLPEDSSNDFSKHMDTTLLTILGGKERTKKEYENLLQQTGFKIEDQLFSEYAQIENRDVDNFNPLDTFYLLNAIIAVPI